MIKKLIIMPLLILLCVSAAATSTQTVYLSGHGSDDAVEWDFFCTKGQNSGKWGKIKVPSCWELQGYGNYNYGQVRDKADEQGLYKRDFRIPAEWKGKRIFIVFEGSMTDTEVKVNGKQAGGIHQGAYYKFKRDITSLVKFGSTNKLDVKVSKMSADSSINEAERYADFWVFGGIFRPVYLEAVPMNHIDYTAIDAKADGAISADVFLAGDFAGAEATMEVQDMDGKAVALPITAQIGSKQGKVSLTGTVAGVKPWSSEHPNRYLAKISIMKGGKVLHTVTEKIGFRTVELRKSDGFYVNGKRIVFKGVNRHPFHPETGRTTNLQISIDDAKLIKQMNMNAVRMSHYPPEKHFLEVCDSLGLYVIDELCGWQYPPVSTKVGTILVEEMLRRDVNHPCIVMWANGNEGGFNFDLDPLYHQFDPQKRPVIHPWGLFSDINTQHYIFFNSGVRDMFNGRDVFVPTEFSHGLYDGGHGAGLDDYWNVMLANPLSAGAFLWDMVDQGVVRTDKNGELDTYTNKGADGILGPYRQKEGSFFTVKEIWSPVYFEKKYITGAWDGTLNIENRFDFTNTSECTFSYKLAQIGSLSGKDTKTKSGKIASVNLEPGQKGKIAIPLPADWRDYDVLYVTVNDHTGMELFTNSFELSTPERYAQRIISAKTKSAPTREGEVRMAEDAQSWTISASGVVVQFGKQNGLLLNVTSDGREIPLKNGPMLVSDQSADCQSVTYKMSDGVAEISAKYNSAKNRREALTFTWKIYPSGIVALDFTTAFTSGTFDLLGVTFDYPENIVEGVDLFANGPYRVYKNRLKGATLGLWDKRYNNTVTGESWDYPEFKGYYSLFYGMNLKGKAPFKVYNTAQDLYLHLFTPEAQKGIDVNHTMPSYPKGDISFMFGISAVGTKFASRENYGPQSMLNVTKTGQGTINPYATLYFDFK